MLEKLAMPAAAEAVSPLNVPTAELVHELSENPVSCTEFEAPVRVWFSASFRVTSTVKALPAGVLEGKVMNAK